MLLTLIFATCPAKLRITGRFSELFPKMLMSLNYAPPAFTLVGSKAAYIGRSIPTFGVKQSLYSLIFTKILWYLPFLKFASILHLSTFTLVPPS